VHKESNFKSRVHIPRLDLTLATLMVFVSLRYIDLSTTLDKIIAFQKSKEKPFLANLNKHKIQTIWMEMAMMM